MKKMITDGSAEEKKTYDEDITENIKNEIATENAGALGAYL